MVVGLRNTFLTIDLNSDFNGEVEAVEEIEKLLNEFSGSGSSTT